MLHLQRHPGQGSHLPVVSENPADRRNIPVTPSQAQGALRHDLEPSQITHWYYRAPPFVLERFFKVPQIQIILSFCFIFVYLCQLYIFLTWLAVLEEASAWSTSTSITEAFPSSVRNRPGWRKWKENGAPCFLSSNWNAHPQPLQISAQGSFKASSGAGPSLQSSLITTAEATLPSFEELLFSSAFLMALTALGKSWWLLLSFVLSYDLSG